MTALTLAMTLVLLVVAEGLERLAGLSDALGPTAAVAFLLVMAIAAAGVAGFHPLASLGPANCVTTARAALVALVAALLAEAPSPTAATTTAIAATVAAVLDGGDGWLARRTHMTSAFGARFDMEVDALLILVLGVFVWRYDKAGAWILLSGALRYGFVVAGWTMAWFRRALPASTRRKAVCVIQIVGLIVAIAPLVDPPWSALAGGTSLGLLVWSFAVDVMWLWRARALPDIT